MCVWEIDWSVGPNSETGIDRIKVGLGVSRGIWLHPGSGAGLYLSGFLGKFLGPPTRKGNPSEHPQKEAVQARPHVYVQTLLS